MKFPRMPSIRAFFGPEPSSGRHQFKVGTHRAEDSRPKHRGTGTAKSSGHKPKHSREARGYDRDDYTGEHRRSAQSRPPAPEIGKRRAKRGVVKGKPLHQLTDR